MKQSTREPLDILYELDEINHDRIMAYTKAIELIAEDENADLHEVFQKYRNQSADFRKEIAPWILQIGQVPEDSKRISGKIFRVWMNLKAKLSPSTRNTLLDVAEHGEKEFNAIYSNILEKEIGEDNPIRPMVSKQNTEQRAAYEHIKTLHSAG